MLATDVPVMFALATGEPEMDVDLQSEAARQVRKPHLMVEGTIEQAQSAPGLLRTTKHSTTLELTPEAHLPQDVRGVVEADDRQDTSVLL